MSRVLIVIDMQNDFVTGSLGSKEAQGIVPNVQAKIKEYADRGDRIIFTRDTHAENYLDTAEGKKLPVIHCIKGTDGWQIIPELEVEGCDFGRCMLLRRGYAGKTQGCAGDNEELPD